MSTYTKEEIALVLQIAELLKMAPRTVDIHRYNIRKKLGINNKKAALTTHLQSLK